MIFAKPLAAAGLSLMVWRADSPASLADRGTIFGVEIGKPVALPACVSPPTAVCLAPGSSTTEVYVLIPTAPDWLAVPGLDIDLLDGNAERITLVTKASQQIQAFRALFEKFGKEDGPLRTETLQNAFGAKQDYLTAEWTHGDLHVAFTGAGAAQSFDKGAIIVFTDKWRQHEGATQRAKDSAAAHM